MIGYEKVYVVVPVALLKKADPTSDIGYRQYIESIPVSVYATYTSLFEHLRKEYDVSNERLSIITESLDHNAFANFREVPKESKFYEDMEIGWYDIEIWDATVYN